MRQWRSMERELPGRTGAHDLEAEKSHSPPLAPRRPRKAGGVVPARPQTQGARGLSPSLRLKTQEPGAPEAGIDGPSPAESKFA